MFIGLEHFVLEWLKTRSGRIIGSAVACLVTTVAAVFVLPIGVRQAQLWRAAVVVRADVRETHVYYDNTTGRKPLRASVRYAFDVGGRTYHYTGPGGGDWAGVSVEREEQASHDRKIDVAYRPADPANNAPADALEWMWAWSAGFVVGPPTLMAFAWAWVARVARDEGDRRARRPLS